jgi:hypothetical protein
MTLRIEDYALIGELLPGGLYAMEIRSAWRE